jgi:hypothetical protein
MLDEAAKSILRRHLELRQQRDEAKKAADALDKEYRESEADLFEMIEESGLKGGLKVDLGEPHGTVTFSNRTTHYGRIIDEDSALEHFSQRAMTDELTKSKWSMRRLHEIVREHIESGEDMPPGVDYRTDRGVSIRRQKK